MGRSKLWLLTLCLLLLGVSSPAEAMVSGGGYWINQVVPSTIGNTGKVTISIIGRMENKPTHVSLWTQETPTEGPKEIVGTVNTLYKDAFYNSWGGTDDFFTATFDLTDAPEGAYQVSFVNPDYPESIIYLYGAITVDAESTSNLWVKITGRTTVRIESSTEYAITYGNSGSTNCPSAILYLAIPKGVNYTLLFDKTPYQKFLPAVLKDKTYGSEPYDQSDVDFDSAQYDLIPLVIQDVPPMAVTPLKVKITWGSSPANYLLRVFWNGDTTSTGYDPIWGTN